MHNMAIHQPPALYSATVLLHTNLICEDNLIQL